MPLPVTIYDSIKNSFYEWPLGEAIYVRDFHDNRKGHYVIVYDPECKTGHRVHLPTQFSIDNLNWLELNEVDYPPALKAYLLLAPSKHT